VIRDWWTVVSCNTERSQKAFSYCCVIGSATLMAVDHCARLLCDIRLSVCGLAVLVSGRLADDERGRAYKSRVRRGGGVLVIHPFLSVYYWVGLLFSICVWHLCLASVVTDHLCPPSVCVSATPPWMISNFSFLTLFVLMDVLYAK